MSTDEKIKLYNKFLEKWTIEKIKDLKLEEYTNTNKKSFTHEIETKLDSLGRIGKVPAFKFGIYKRSKEGDKNKKSNRQFIYKDKYAWYKKYGDETKNEKDIFEKVKEKLIKVVQYAQNSDLNGIRSVDLPNIFKWKVAFMYQNPNDVCIVPIYKEEALRWYVQEIGKFQKNMSISDLYMIIKDNEKFSNLKGCLEAANKIWEDYKKSKEIKENSFNPVLEKKKIEKEKKLSPSRRANATSDADYIEYVIKAHRCIRRNPHNKLEKSFNKYLQQVLNAQKITQDDNYIDFHFEFKNKKYICELKPSDNQKEISYAIQGAIGQILRYSHNKDFDIKMIVFQGEPKGDNLRFLEYLAKEHNVYYLYEEKSGFFRGNCIN